MVEKAVGKTATKTLMPMQPGDVKSTVADVAQLEAVTGFKPSTSLEQGIGRFVEWYRSHYGE